MGRLRIPAIRYSTAPLNNVVVDVNRKLQEGAVHSRSRGAADSSGRRSRRCRFRSIRSCWSFRATVLQGQADQRAESPRALLQRSRRRSAGCGTASSSKWRLTTSLQASCSTRSNSVTARRTGRRSSYAAFRCLGCHASGDTLGVPGLLMFSTDATRSVAGPGVPRRVDHSEPLTRRFGGWFVTGSAGSRRTWAMTSRRSRARRPRARIGGGVVRSGWLSCGFERHRCPPGVRAPDGHDEPSDARQLRSARRGSVAAPALHVHVPKKTPASPR